MKDILLETPWETRNLGVSSFVVSEDSHGNLDEALLKSQLDALKAKGNAFFAHARVAQENMHSVPILEKNGFYTVESTLCPFMRLKSNSCLLEFKKDKSAFLPPRYADDMIDFLELGKDIPYPIQELKEIALESFSGDRFHCDWQCGDSVSDRRFSYWMDDLISKDSVLIYALLVKGKLAGFWAREQNSLILTGFSKKYLFSGLGAFFCLNVCDEIEKEGFKVVNTLISVNNLPALHLYSKLGFGFRNVKYTFHYWHFPGSGN